MSDREGSDEPQGGVSLRWWMWLRVRVVSRVVWAVLGVLAAVEGEFGSSDDDSSPDRAPWRPNATLVLRRVRSVRQPQVHLLAERIRSDRWELALLGRRVQVERDGDGLVLIAPSGAHVGPLVWDPEQPWCRCTGSGLDGPVYGLSMTHRDRRRRRRDSQVRT